MPGKRLDYVSTNLNSSNDTVANGMVTPILGTQEPGNGLNLGDWVDLTDSEASNLSSTTQTLYRGRYQRIIVDSAATAANVKLGTVAYMLSTTQPYRVTDYSHALSVNLPSGVFLNSITPGNYGWIQVLGKMTVLGKTGLTNGSPAIGDVVQATTGGVVDDPTQSGNPTFANLETAVGVAETLPASATLFQVRSLLVFEQD